MFRILLILLFFACSANAIAQVAITPIKSTDKKQEQPIDYKQMGAPMPMLRMLKYEDTGKKKEAAAEAAKADTATTTLKNRKKKKKQPVIEKVDAPLSADQKKYITNKDLDNNANLFVMMFNPTCSHCEDETELLEKNIFLFKKSKIVLLANPLMWDYFPNFSKSFHIAEYPTISLGVDTADFISKVFLYSALPQINIYNGQRKLIKTFAGEVIIDSLRAYIQ